MAQRKRKIYGEKDLVRRTAKKTNYNLRTTHSIINSFLDNIIQILRTKHSVRLVGFGRLDVTHYKKRNGRNPQTKKPMVLPAHNTASFHEGLKLRRAINKK